MSAVSVWPQGAVSVPSSHLVPPRPAFQTPSPWVTATVPPEPEVARLGSASGAEGGEPGGRACSARLFTSPGGRASSLSLSYLFLCDSAPRWSAAVRWRGTSSSCEVVASQPSLPVGAGPPRGEALSLEACLSSSGCLGGSPWLGILVGA